MCCQVIPCARLQPPHTPHKHDLILHNDCENDRYKTATDNEMICCCRGCCDPGGCCLGGGGEAIVVVANSAATTLCQLHHRATAAELDRGEKGERLQGRACVCTVLQPRVVFSDTDFSRQKNK